MDTRRRHTRSGPSGGGDVVGTPPAHKDFAQLVRLTPAFGPPPNPCQEVLKPILTSLSVVGVYVQIRSTRRRRDTLQYRLWCLLVFLYLLLNVALNLSQMTLKNGRNNILDNIAKLMGGVTACLISSNLAFNAHPLQLLHDEISALFDLLPPVGVNAAIQRAKRYSILLTTLGWIFLALRFVAMLTLLDNSPPDDQYLTIFQSFPPPSYSAAAITLAIAVHSTAEIFFVAGSLVFVPVYFMSLCLLTALVFRRHNAVIAEGGSAAASEFSRARRLHERLCGVVLAIDGVFAFAVFAWCLLIILSACLDLTQLFTDDNLLRDLGRDQLFAFTLRGVYSALVFVGTCLTAARVSEEAHAALPAVHALTLRHSHLTLDAKMEAQLLVCRLTAPHVGLTAWHFFHVDRSFILNITAAVTTYMVIIIQLNPKAVKAINKLVTEALNTTSPVVPSNTTES